MQVKNCAHCGDLFSTYLDKQKYCSKSCNDQARRYGGLRYAVIVRDGHKCTKCGSNKDLHVHHIDEDIKHNVMSNLVTLCQFCHKSHHQSGAKNTKYKHIEQDQIERAINSTSNLDEASELLGLSRSTLRKKRQQHEMGSLPVGRSGKDSKLYVDVKLHEIEMAYQLEGTWVKAAERLGLSESFIRRRYKELKGLDSVQNRIYKNISKEEILNAYEKGGNWVEAAKLLNISKKTMLSKRKKFGLFNK